MKHVKHPIQVLDQWWSWRHFTSHAPRLAQARGPGACTPGKILIFELWNGHFLRFQGEIHAKRAIKKRVIRGNFTIYFRRKRKILYVYILIPCCNLIFHLELHKVNCSILLFSVISVYRDLVNLKQKPNVERYFV
jgi:hypothetical protein